MVGGGLCVYVCVYVMFCLLKIANNFFDFVIEIHTQVLKSLNISSENTENTENA